MQFLMCEEQLTAYRSGDVERMTIGLFRCAHAAPNVTEDDEVCDHVGLWEADVESEPDCRQCLRPAALVEVVER
jgi:hypothetical protein